MAAIAILFASLIAGLLWGDISLGWNQILDTFQGKGSALAERVLFNLRLPRLLVALLAGASLAVSGLLLQGVVRNPLAGPEIVGMTSGSGFAALLILVFVPNAPVEIVPLAAFIGAFAAIDIVYLASWRNGVSPARLALVVMAKLRVAQALV